MCIWKHYSSVNCGTEISLLNLKHFETSKLYRQHGFTCILPIGALLNQYACTDTAAKCNTSASRLSCSKGSHKKHTHFSQKGDFFQATPAGGIDEI